MITATARTKSFGALLVAALFVALLPALPAAAAPTATAELTAGTNVFPSADGDTRDFTIDVANSGGLGDEAVTDVRVVLPTNSAGVSLTDDLGSPPSGWSVRSVRGPSGLEVLLYEADDGLFPGIQPGNSEAFTFPAAVERPQNSEEDGPFDVSVSSDGSDFEPATAPDDGTLTTTVEILEVLNDVAVRAPEGAADGSATAGQTVTVGYSVRNHAIDTVSVSGELASSDTSAATPSSPVVLDVPGDPSDATLFEHSVSTNPDISNNTQVTFDASATSSGADAEQNPSGVLEIQVPSLINLDEDSFEPTSVRSGIGTAQTQFTIDASKNGTPNLTISDGSLSFATTSATLIDGPYELSGGSTTLTFETSDPISGAGGLHDVDFSFPDVEDSNGFVDSHALTLADLIEIDDIAPDLTVNVEIPEGQDAVKNGDNIRVYGEIVGDDAMVDELEVVLTPDVGEQTTVPVSTTETETGFTYEGTVEADFEDGRADDSEEEQQDPSNPFAKSFTASASVVDDAGNEGGASTSVSDTGVELTVDNVIPFLSSPGRTGRDDNGNTVIRIEFEDNHPLEDNIAGGCDPSLYRIDGRPGRVSEVRGADGGPCSDTEGDSGTRFLVMDEQLREDADPPVTYDPRFVDLNDATPAHDGAINNAVLETIQTVVGLAPAPPEIIEVTRNDGAEAAYNDGEGYWTRFGGDDLTVTFGGFEDGYTIQVLDENGNVLNEKELTRNKIGETNEDAPGETGEDTIVVPIGDTDGDYVRRLRFLSDNTEAPAGVPEEITVNLDQVAPSIASLARSGQEVTVNFDDQLIAGTNFDSDWYGAELNDEGERIWRGASDVATTSDPSQRILTFNFDDPSTFDAAQYLITGQDSVRYEDRAGNLMPDHIASS